MAELDRLPELWQAIYGPGPGFVALFSGLRPHPTAKLTLVREAYFGWPGELAAARAWIAREATKERDLYHCSHLVTRWRRRKEDAAPLSSLYVDLDTGMPSAPLVAPSVTVESSPGRYQAYFRLTRPIRPEAGEALNRRLAYALGADPSGYDLTQLLRIPGTVNHKYEDRPLVRLVELREHSYPPEDLDALLPRLPTAHREGTSSRPSDLPPVGSDPPIPLSRSALRVWIGEDAKLLRPGVVDRSGSLVRIARMLYQAKVPREVIVAALAERDESLGWRKYAGRQDAVEQYHRVVDVVARGVPTQRR